MIGFDRNVMVVVTLGLRRVGRALPGLVLALALGIAVVLLAAPVAFAYDRPTDLRRVASIFAMRDAEVRCPSSAEWIADPIWGTGPNPSRAWGYTDMIEEYIVLHPALCARGAGRLRRAASAVAAGDGGTRAPTRGLPRAPLEMAPERGQGRVPGDPPFHDRGATARCLPRARERAASVCACRTCAHGDAVPRVPGPHMHAAHVGFADVTVEGSLRLQEVLRRMQSAARSMPYAGC